MIHLDGQLETSDMTFAVVLCLNGFHPLMERRGQNVIWIMEDEDGLKEFIDEFQRGNVLVEPRRFSREFAAMRKDVYKVLGIGNQPRGVRVARSVSDGS